MPNDSDDAFHEAMRQSTPRAQRALRFSRMVEQMLEGFLPTQRDCRRAISDHLTRLGYDRTFEIISMPLELDELDQIARDKFALEVRAKLEMNPLFLTLLNALRL